VRGSVNGEHSPLGHPGSVKPLPKDRVSEKVILKPRNHKVPVRVHRDYGCLVSREADPRWAHPKLIALWRAVATESAAPYPFRLYPTIKTGPNHNEIAVGIHGNAGVVVSKRKKGTNRKWMPVNLVAWPRMRYGNTQHPKEREDNKNLATYDQSKLIQNSIPPMFGKSNH